MKTVSAVFVVICLSAALAGCVDGDQKQDVGAEGAQNQVRRVIEPVSSAVQDVTNVAFAPLMIIDSDHAGGEPVIIEDHKNVLVLSSHPGYTHVRGADTDLVTSTNGQVYVWRSEDSGATWQFVGLPVGVDNGPRNAATSVSDPDLTLRPDNGIILTTLQSLVAIPVEISTDSGKTWSGQPVHGPVGVDRNWVAACNNQDVYQVYTFLPAGRWFAHSTDGGQTWLDQHQTNAQGNIICDQLTENGKYLYAGAGSSLSVSVDQGATFKRATAAEGVELPRGTGNLGRPAVDRAGNVYTAGIANGTSENATVYYTVSTDHGQTISRVVTIPTRGIVNGSHVWPWITAQDPGHIGIVFYGASQYGQPTSFDREATWDVYSVIVPNALDAEPTAYVSKASNLPIHRGAICIGTVCQADPNESGDRRLGDFFTAIFDHTGALVIATGSTQAVPATGPVDGGGLSHPAFIRQTAGPGGLEGMVVGAMDHDMSMG